MAKGKEKKQKDKTMIQIILLGISKIEQHEPQWRVGVNSGDPEGYAVPSPRPVILYITRCQILTSKDETNKE